MQIPIDALRDAPGKTFAFNLSVTPADLELDEDGVHHTSPIGVRIQAVYKDGKLYLKGNLRTDVQLACSRCLRPITCHFEGEAEETITPADNQSQADVSELAKEMYYAGFPLKPLCSEDCKGLCAACGADMNVKQCGCNVVKTDDRLAILKKLLDE